MSERPPPVSSNPPAGGPSYISTVKVFFAKKLIFAGRILFLAF